ncbi:MAG: MBL fold metallo-hydrolase [Burkholderiaceae bacterium]
MRTPVREQKLLYGWREPPVPIPAATVLLVRDGPGGLELLMTRRSLRASFAPGAYVFPGGRVDEQDHAVARAAGVAEPQVGDEAYRIAAIREAFEELGVLFARRETGRLVDQARIDQLDRDPGRSLAAQLQAAGLTLARDQLHWFSHWITDRDLPRRFDTRFFIARMPEGQQPVADETEQFAPEWVVPAHGLARYERGEFNIIFPTIRTLRQLKDFSNTDQLLDWIQGEREMWRSSPRAGHLRGDIARFCENEPPFGELELVSPDGSIRHTLDWQHEPVRLLHHVTRITAPNPGRMTGPGTNTYVIGEPGGYLVVDPGPDIDEHVARIADLVGQDLKAIVCTHSHPDHYPGAKPLRERLGLPAVPILGRPSGPLFNPAWPFTPDRVLEDGEILTIGDTRIKVLHTPGHASNHVCLLLEQDRLLVSGDHILNGSTTVVDHPDGNMKAYIDSLHRLAGEDIAYILPAHGYVLGRAKHEIEALIRHRLRREAKVLAALASIGQGSLDELVLLAYDDVDPILHPVAKRSLAAHLHKLAEDGKASVHGDRWRISH